MQPVIDDAAKMRLALWLSDTLGRSVVILHVAPLKGGGIQENWILEAEINGAPQSYVLRKDAPATIEASHSRRHEFAIIEAA
ncbi:MAG: phosphotransferase family protein, partial [Beijerinckiaceae bacterium]